MLNTVIKKLTLLALFTAASLPLAVAQEWLTDFEAAQKQAKAENKPLLIDFTGSDWCGWCIKLDREVLDTPQFKEYAAKNLVLFKADFPRRKELPAKVRAQNEALAQKYGIQGFPTLILQSPSGKPIKELGYMPGGPAAFIRELEKK